MLVFHAVFKIIYIAVKTHRLILKQLLLNINFNLVKWSVTSIEATHCELNVISGGLRQPLTEPWRAVERAASAGRTTPIPIPQWVIDVEFFPLWRRLYTHCSVTEVVVFHEFWHFSSIFVIRASSSAWTCMIVVISF